MEGSKPVQTTGAADWPLLSPVSRLLFLAAFSLTVLAGGMVLSARMQSEAPVVARAPANPAPAAVTPDTIRAALLAAGYQSVQAVRARGPNFSVDAIAAGGLETRLVIHGGTGAILGIRIRDEMPGSRSVDTARR